MAPARPAHVPHPAVLDVGEEDVFLPERLRLLFLLLLGLGLRGLRLLGLRRLAVRGRAGRDEGHRYEHCEPSCHPILLGCQTALSPRSPVLIRSACSRGSTKTFPSPMLPVRAAATISPTTRSAAPSETTTSTFIFGRKSTVYSLPRYISVWPFCRPKPRTSLTVIPTKPAPVSASFTSSSLNGLMIAAIFFIDFSWRRNAFYGFSTRALRRHRGHPRCPDRGRAHGMHERGRPLDLGIAVGSHLGHVEALQLDLGTDAHAEDEVVDLEEDPGGREDEGEARGGPDDLSHELARPAIEEAAHRTLDAVEAVAVGAVGGEAEAEHPPGAVDDADRDGAARIV